MAEHDAEVRLLRYEELIEKMSAEGVKAGEDWVLVQGAYDDGYGEKVVRCKDTLNLKQIMAFAQAMSYGWYYYTNFDNLFVGRGVGVAKVSPAAQMMGAKDMEMDVDETILMNQCIDIERQYQEFKRPLGPEAVFKAEREGKVGRVRKINRGRNNRGGIQSQPGWGSRPHFKEIITYLTRLLEAIDQHLLPTDATGVFVSHVAEMLESAARYDLAVASALLNKGASSCGLLVIKLMKRAAKIAEASPAKGETFKRIWWQSSSSLMGALCYSVMTLFEKGGEDADDATTFFFNILQPELVNGVESPLPQAKSFAFDNLVTALAVAPPTVLMRFMEKKGSWARIESACRTSLNVASSLLSCRLLGRRRTLLGLTT